MTTEKISPEELREIGLEVDGQAANMREPVHACMTCRFKIKGSSYVLDTDEKRFDRCGARGGLFLLHGRKTSLNDKADCSIWEPKESREIAKREWSEIVPTYPPIVHVVKWISIAFIVWAVCG